MILLRTKRQITIECSHDKKELYLEVHGDSVAINFNDDLEFITRDDAKTLQHFLAAALSESDGETHG